MNSRALLFSAGLLLLVTLAGCKSSAGFGTGYSVNHSIEIRPASVTQYTNFKLSFGFTSTFTIAGEVSKSKDLASPVAVLDAESDLYLLVRRKDGGAGYEPYQVKSGWIPRTFWEERKYILWVEGDQVKVRKAHEETTEGRLVKICKSVPGREGVFVYPELGYTNLQLGAHTVQLFTEKPTDVCK